MQLPGFDAFDFDAGTIRHTVFHRGSGPGVVLLHELPGMSTACIRLGERIAESGFHVYLPLLFGRPGDHKTWRNLARICIRREFLLFAEQQSSPVVDWVRALCRKAWKDCAGPGVGAIGMCLTGNFALSLMADEFLLAPVACQPSLPFAIGAARKAALAVSPEELAAAQARAYRGARLLGLRFSEDGACPRQRFATLRRELGPAFEEIELDSSAGNPYDFPPSAHSVLTDEFVDSEGHPTHAALQRVLDFLHQHLRPGTEAVPA